MNEPLPCSLARSLAASLRLQPRARTRGTPAAAALPPPPRAPPLPALSSPCGRTAAVLCSRLHRARPPLLLRGSSEGEEEEVAAAAAAAAKPQLPPPGSFIPSPLSSGEGRSGPGNCPEPRDWSPDGPPPQLFIGGEERMGPCSDCWRQREAKFPESFRAALQLATRETRHRF
ncbi:uncharacterized protein PHA67_011689 isoform 2-T2 [Liasis olivaceus]